MTDPIEAAIEAAYDAWIRQWTVSRPNYDCLRAAIAAYEKAKPEQAEIEALRAQVKDKDCAVSMLAAQTRAKLDLLGESLALKAQLADCHALLRRKGHDADCPANECMECGKPADNWRHDEREVPNPHDFRPCACSDACGIERCGVGL